MTDQDLMQGLIEVFKPYIHCATCSVCRREIYLKLRKNPDDPYLQQKYAEVIAAENKAVEACAELLKQNGGVFENADQENPTPTITDSSSKEDPGLPPPVVIKPT